MSQSPYAQVGPRLVQLGYSAIPIAPGSKAPGVYWPRIGWRLAKKWSRYCTKTPDEADVKTWCGWPDAGVGLCLGPASGVVAVDFDNRPELWPILEKLLPESPVRKRGEKGYTAFYRYTGQVKRQVKFEAGDKPIVEILALGQQTLIPPTIHPTTDCPYVWDGESLLDFPRSGLPTLPDDIYEKFCEALGILPEMVKHTPRVYEVDDVPSLEMVERMLDCISSSCGRDTWIRIGSAIKSAYPGEDGFKLWNQWSKGSDKYKEKEMPGQWRSLKPERGISIGTLYYHAIKEGFEDLGYDIDRRLEGVSDELHPKPQAPEVITDRGEGPAQIDLAIPDDLVESAPGLVGDIARWITSVAIRPQPVLSLAAAIAAVGVIKGHKFATDTDLRTNLYCLGIAKSGSGKNDPIIAIKKLFAAAGCDYLLGKEIGSGPAICPMLEEGDGRAIVLWDEFGHAISAMTAHNAPVHIASIIPEFTKFFSESNSYHAGKVLVAGSRNNIDQPCLAAFCVTVPDILFDSMSSTHAVDGFLARWLMFQADGRPKKNKRPRSFAPPKSIEERVRTLGKRADKVQINRVDDEGKTQIITQVIPKVIPFTPAARERLDLLDDEFDRIAESVEDRNDGTESLWLRAGEHIAKLALTVCDGDEIGEAELDWATRLVKRQCFTLSEAVGERIGRNVTERNLKKVLRIIREAGPEGLYGTEFNRKTQWLSLTERSAIVETLIDSGQIQGPKEKGKKGRGPKPNIFRVL